ncbi:MAG: HEAT repeat domain-containing protein [Pseudomonadota bacterium]
MSADFELAKKYLEELGEPISLSIALCEDYSALLRGEHGAPLSHADLLQLAAQRGRILLSGRGGSGKSTIMRRLLIDAEAEGKTAVFMDLSRWDHDASEGWMECREGAREAIDFLLRRFGSGDKDVADLDFLPARQEKVLIIDGLNETPGSVADDIVSACDQAASLMINCSVIVSDRLVRRRLNGDDRWYFAMPLNVDIEEARRHLDVDAFGPAAQRLLDSPYFVDKGMKGALKDSPLATIRDFVESRGKLDAVGMAIAAKSAFTAYRHDESRSFDLARFSGEAGAAVAQTLQEGGVLCALPGGRVAFNHHWVHDYLAAKYLASHPDLWSFEHRHASLDSLTFKANSFDAVAFALEQMDGDAKNGFLQAVYDWNPYAAGYALAEVEEISRANISPSLRMIILAMLAERKFDRHYLSARKAHDALELFKDDTAISMRNAEDRGELMVIVSAEPEHSDIFARWKALFTTPSDGVASQRTVNAVKDDNSIIGWTAANVLKRLSISERHIDQIAEIAKRERPVIRWRASHVMGSATEQKFRETLLDQVTNDPDENVRYGAIRSLVEIGSRSPIQAKLLVEEIMPRLDKVAESPRVLTELKRAVFLSKGCAPEGWSTEISRLFYARADLATDPRDMEAWFKLSSELRQHDRLAA